MPTATRVAVVTSLALLLIAVAFARADAVVSVAVSNAFATPGGTASVTIAISGGHGLVLDVALDIFFDDTNLSIDTTDCVIAPRLAATHALSVFLPGDPAPPGQKRLRLGLFDESVPPPNTFSDGDIATCTFTVAADADVGETFPLVIDPDRLEVINDAVPPGTLDSMGTNGSISTGDAEVTLCSAAPREGCRSAVKNVLLIKNNSADKKDKLTFKWTKGTATTREEFADPTNFASYALCVYAAGELVYQVAVGPGAPWKALTHKGFKYKDKAGATAGVTKVVVKSGVTGKAKAIVVGKGVNLPDVSIGSLPAPVQAQLFNSSSGTCWESIYDDAAILKNSAKKFKAKVVP